MELTHIDLFSGIGGFSLAGEWAGFRTIVFCEKNKFCQRVLKKHWPKIPIVPEIRDFDGTKWQGATLLTGGFPCQPFSVAGKRRGENDDRYLWPEMFRVISEARPAWVLAENVAGIIHLALDKVLTDLESEGYKTETFIIPACAVNAPHRRDRVWIIANTSKTGIGDKNRETNYERRRVGKNRHACIRQANGAISTSRSYSANNYAPHSKRLGWTERTREEARHEKQKPEGQDIRNSDTEGNAPDTTGNGFNGYSKWKQRSQEKKGRMPEFITRNLWQEDWYEVATKLCRVDDGFPAKLDGFELSKSAHRRERLKALGNAIVPQVACEIMRNIRKIEEGVLNEKNKT